MHIHQVNSSSSAEVDAAGSTYWLDDPCSRFDFFYNTVFIGTLCLLGIATNLLSIVVLYLDRHNRVATFLLRSLAVADISVLVLSFVVMSIFFGTHALPGFYMQHTRYAIPYLKKVGRLLPKKVKVKSAVLHKRAWGVLISLFQALSP